MSILLLCIKIFFIRILDVSLGTVRMILIVKEKRFMASIIGFIEVAVWFTVVKQALTTADTSLWIVIAYSGGFATGTYIGSFISGQFIQGNFTVQVITSKKDDMVNTLRENGYGVSVIDARGKDETQPKYILFIQINKKRFNHLRDLIKELDEKAFIVVNETKHVQNGYFK
jgi:uncharacterized protein YebE (UPF0316 family)